MPPSNAKLNLILPNLAKLNPNISNLGNYKESAKLVPILNGSKYLSISRIIFHFKQILTHKHYKF